MANFALNNLQAKKAVIIRINPVINAAGLAKNFKRNLYGGRWRNRAEEGYVAKDKDLMPFLLN